MSSARCAAARALKAGKPSPRVARRDPYALRALVLLACIATFFAAGGERWKRVAAAFDWQGVGAAGEFPRRRLGGAAGLYRQAAAGAARHSSRRHGGGAGAGRRSVRRAGQLDADRALDRQRQSRHFRQRRRHAVERSGAGAGRHAGASLCHHRHRHGDVARRRRRSDLAVQRHSRQSADHRAHQGSAGAEPRLAVFVLPARGRLRRDGGRGDLRAQG